MDETDPEASAESRNAATARLLGILGAVPFVVLTLWLHGIAADHPWRNATISLLAGYSALVLSFLGGIRWGFVLSKPRQGGRFDLFAGIVPMLGGWAALAIPAPLVFAALAVAFAAQGAWDSLSAHSGAAPAWYGRLRMGLTACAVAAMIVAFMSTS